MRFRSPSARTGLLAVSLLSALTLAGCTPAEKQPPRPPSDAMRGGSGGGSSAPPGMNGPAGGERRGGRRGGPRGPVAASASGAEIYAERCQNCHGAKGEGARAPALASAGSMAEGDLKSIIQNGKGKMPPAGKDLSADQLGKLIAHLKTLKG